MNWFWFFSPAMSEKWSGEQKRGGNNRVPWLLRLYIACGWKAKNFFSGRTLFSRLLPFCCLVFFQICFFALANNWRKNKKVYPAEKPTFFSHLLPWQSNGGSFPSTILLEKKEIGNSATRLDQISLNRNASFLKSEHGSFSNASVFSNKVTILYVVNR